MWLYICNIGEICGKLEVLQCLYAEYSYDHEGVKYCFNFLH